jgi:hypothetical protein
LVDVHHGPLNRLSLGVLLDEAGSRTLAGLRGHGGTGRCAPEARSATNDGKHLMHASFPQAFLALLPSNCALRQCRLIHYSMTQDGKATSCGSISPLQYVIWT